MRRPLLLVAVGAAAAYVIAFRLGEGERGWVSYDVYFYFYPHILHALRSIAAGGAGLLWNPFQNCGQPFFANIETGLIYPPNLLFLALDPQLALRGVLFINLVLGGLGMVGLGRELGVRPAAALGGALAFVLGAWAYRATIWMPTVQAPYVWMPMAMWCCERLVKVPTLRRALVLGLVLAVALLPGHPQFVLFICQMVVLRLLWSLFDRSERRRLPHAIGGVGLAFVVMLLLGAVQYLPALELVAESVRSAPLDAGEIAAPVGVTTMRGIAKSLRTHSALAPFAIIPGIIAAAAWVSPALRRAALFYSVTGILFLGLSFGHATPLGRFYFETPPGQMFREPARFTSVTGFSLSVLTGLAIDVLIRGSWSSLAVAVAALVGLHAWAGPLPTIDWWLACAVLAGGLLAAVAPVARPAAALLIVGTVALAPVLIPHRTIWRFLADDTPLRAHADLFEGLRARLTPHHRVHLATRPAQDPGFQDKTATLFGLRAIADYELQGTRRYAEYLTMMLNGKPFESVNRVYLWWMWKPREVKWPLVDLAAARYIVIDESRDDPLGHSRLTRVGGDDGIRVYENPDALPRAYYVAQIAVMPDAEERLGRLAAGGEDRLRLALVDAAPQSGFLGVAGNGAVADVRFAVDDPERVVLEAVAPERGFLFLADQYFPGWSATVNGRPAPILLGNHAFRLVEVPKGPARVEFRYRPRRVWIGALVSGFSLAVVIGMLLSTFRRRSDHPRS